MLSYIYIRNNSEHINVIGSDSNKNNIAIYINGTFSKFVKPNLVRKGVTDYEYTKIFNHGFNVLENLHSGSIASYQDDRINSLIFNKLSYIYVKNNNGDYLHRNPEVENEYEWHSTLRTKFFFNPYFWDCEHLWEKTIGYVPTAVTTTKQWPEDLAITYFSKRTLVINEGWIGFKAINTIEPHEINRFVDNSIGTRNNYKLSHLIDLEASFGDEVLLTNGKQKLSFIYNKLDDVYQSGKLIDYNGDYILDAYGNYIITTEPYPDGTLIDIDGSIVLDLNGDYVVVS